jgi:hypothetical protein
MRRTLSDMDTATHPGTARLLPDPEESPTVPLWPVAGRALGLGKSATYNAANRGEIPVIRFKGRVVVPTAALRRMLQLDPERTIEHTGGAAA